MEGEKREREREGLEGENTYDCYVICTSSTLTIVDLAAQTKLMMDVRTMCGRLSQS